MATMAVENSEERCLFYSWSQRLIWLRSRLLEVKHDGYPVFIVIPGRAIVRVCSIGENKALGLTGDL